MPLVVKPHTDFETLFRALGNPMDPSALCAQYVVIPTVQFGGYLRCRLARQFGICMGLQLLTPQTFVHTAVGPGEGSPWLREQLRWTLLPLVPKYRKHLGVDDSQTVRDDFAVAGLLADRLDGYGHHRPEWIVHWSQGEANNGGSSSPTANWQIDLWREVSRIIGPDHPHPALQLHSARSNEALLKDLRQRFPKLKVLAGGTLDPLLVEVLQLMDFAGCSIDLHVLLPALGYLADFAHKRPAHFQENLDAEELDFASGHPLLTSMGRHSIGTFALLEKLDPNYSNWPEPDFDQAAEAPPSAQKPSVLHQLQQAIRTLSYHPQNNAPSASGTPDISIHSCFGIRRELETVQDVLLAAFADIPNLQPEDVHIMVPDLDAYAPLARAVLGSGVMRLPLRTTERPLTSENHMTQALLLVLQCVVVRRLQASDVAALLYNEAVQAHLDCADTEGLRNWLIACGFTSGTGTEQPGFLGAARDRLVAGQWFGSDTDARYPSGEWVLPEADQLGGDFALMSRFCAWLSQLEQTFLTWQQPCTAQDWAKRIRQAAPLLLTSNSDELLELQDPLQRLQIEPCSVDLDAGVISDWLTEQVKSAAVARNHSGSILMGRMNQLQHLPCKVLVIMGMGSAFPAQNRTPSWDLLRQHPKIWDRNARLDGRQQFLDALLTPTERLIITAPNKNVRTAKQEPFSACVEELLRVLPPQAARVIHHRLQPFAPDYFKQDSDFPPTHDANNARVAELVHQDLKQRTVPTFAQSIPTDSPEMDETFIDTQALNRFWKDPAEVWIRHLNIAKAYQEVADTDLDHQPLSLDSLQSYKVNNLLMEQLLQHDPSTVDVAARDWLHPQGPVQKLKCWLQATRSFPPQNIGDSDWVALVETMGQHAKRFLKLCAYHRQVSLPFPPWGDLQSQALFTDKLEQPVWLYWRIGNFKDLKHFLTPWIHANIAALSGDPSATLLICTKEAKAQILPPIDPTDAADNLRYLLQGMTAGMTFPLPFTVGMSWKLAEFLEKQETAPDDPDFPLEAALEKLTDLLNAEPFNGVADWQQPAFKLAWRGIDPLDQSEQWLHWSHKVALPILTWCKKKKSYENL